MIIFNNVYSKEISLMASIIMMGISLRPMWIFIYKYLYLMKKACSLKNIIFIRIYKFYIKYYFYTTILELFLCGATTNFCLITASFYGFLRKEFIELQMVSYKPLFWFVLFYYFYHFFFLSSIL